MEIFEDKSFDGERAFYGKSFLTVKNCSFDGPADGESAFKEGNNINVDSCFFNLRYPFWHDMNLSVSSSEMTEFCRAALWYSDSVTITSSKLHGIKAVRECKNVKIKDCDIISPEFGWFSEGIDIKDSTVESEYFLMRSLDISLNNVKMKGKYSFQYIKNSVFENCEFDTKDAFWHAKGVTVRNCIVKGEYLGWYSEDLTFENCKIIGTQPLCYCKNLKMINCEMIDTDLSFERSEVEAVILSPVVSIKNPLSGHIYLPEVGEVIIDIPQAKGEIIVKSRQETV